jgi:hypothetical protein
MGNHDFVGAKAAYEETYELMDDTHGPNHPEALKIISLLISILIELREFKDAERFARHLYNSLTSPIDTESEEVAKAANNLASMIYFFG